MFAVNRAKTFDEDDKKLKLSRRLKKVFLDDELDDKFEFLRDKIASTISGLKKE